MNARNSYTFLKAISRLAANMPLKGGRVWLAQDLRIPTFIPRQVASLYSSIVRYERCFLLRAECNGAAVAPKRRQHLTSLCNEPRTVLMPSYESMRASLLVRAVADLVSR